MARVSKRLGLQPGDIFFCRGRGPLDRLINWFQGLRDTDGDTRRSHVGVVLNSRGHILETTSWRTGYRSLARHYAGSDLQILRLSGMTSASAWLGLCAVAHQVGLVYPYWRLLVHAVGLPSGLHLRGMECSALTAHFLAGAGVDLAKPTPWAYDADELGDELAARADCTVVHDGSLRAAGHIEE